MTTAAQAFLQQTFDITRKTALITGGSKGLGKRVAEALSSAGANVAICSRNKDEAQQVAAAMAESSGIKAAGYRCDVASKTEVEKLVREVTNDFGSIDIVIACAGINIRKETKDLTEADWDDVIDINLKGSFLVAQAVLPLMYEQNWGRIIFFGSNQSVISIPNRSPYGASKSGILGLTRTLALESATKNVCVNAVCPGPFRTPMNEVVMQDKAAYTEFIRKLPIGRWGEPEELDGLMIYLSSNACSFMTGSTILIDGGWTAH